MAVLTPKVLAEQVASAALGVAASVGGDLVPIGRGNGVLVVFTNGATAAVVTVTPSTPNRNDVTGPFTISNRVINVGANETKVLKITKANFIQNEALQVPLTYTTPTTLKVDVIAL